MMATIASKPIVIVLLDSLGKYTRVADAQRVKHWLETGESAPASAVMAERAPRGGIKGAASRTHLKHRVTGTFPAHLAKTSARNS